MHGANQCLDDTEVPIGSRRETESHCYYCHDGKMNSYKSRVSVVGEQFQGQHPLSYESSDVISYVVIQLEP